MRVILTIFLTGLTLTLWSCQTETSNPITGYIPNDTSNGGGGNSPWILEGPVVYQNGVLTASCPSGANDTVFAVATTRFATNFGGSQLVTFSWREDVAGRGSCQFFVGSDTLHLQELNITEVSPGVMRAQLSFFLGFDEPLISRFIFNLRPLSSVKVMDYKGEGD